MSYLFDLHVHTEESSNCGKTPAEQVVERYKNLAYDGICITDHMNKDNAERHGDTYEEKARSFLEGYKTAKQFETENFKVILGMEIRFTDAANDYLVFGFDEDFVFSRDFTVIENLKEFRKIADKNNLVVFQAHPFRNSMKIVEPKLLDGMEVYNGHGGHDSRNEVAYHWAKKYGLRMSGGSDFHYETGKEPGGVYFERLPEDSFELAALLMENTHKLKTFEK